MAIPKYEYYIDVCDFLFLGKQYWGKSSAIELSVYVCLEIFIQESIYSIHIWKGIGSFVNIYTLKLLRKKKSFRYLLYEQKMFYENFCINLYLILVGFVKLW